jgi:hypothetical protein
MEKPFKTSVQLGKNAREIRCLYHDPIFIPHNPEPIDDDSPPETENFLGDIISKAIFVILALFLFRWCIGGLLGGHAPDLDFISTLIQHSGGQ